MKELKHEPLYVYWTDWDELRGTMSKRTFKKHAQPLLDHNPMQLTEQHNGRIKVVVTHPEDWAGWE